MVKSGKKKTGAAAPMKFLVCVDKSKESHTALRVACMKAKKSGALVDILHVVAPADFQSFVTIAGRIEEETRAEAEGMLKEMSQQAYAWSGITPSIIFREGAQGEEILAAAAEDPDICIVVMGATQKSANGKLISWLADQLGNRLKVPLLLVPGNLSEQQLEALA